ncbi:ATP-dependent Clp protease proteolytic subunit [uncultured Bacteroides sp.]|uniref:ATP-dependent Clp protease proteolytic subunit n=1 Tax=uncultured Bacteroides sp. TaxID=162156 RepID=UPI002AAB5ED7|nr:ATP-dependent Clp protease proteolytic subunit [uncultured Bacteroides sp.]
MAVLKIYNDIADEESKNMNLMFTGVDSTCFKDIDEFLASISEDDKSIDIKMNCRGGSVTEGWAIYDKLRDSGKEISVTVEGLCASMATVLLLSAPAERRFGLPNSEYLIHAPYIPEYTLADAYRSEDLHAIADELEADTEKLLNLYVERTGAEKEELASIMAEDKCITVSEAKRLGFISKIKMPTTAKYNQFKKSMKKEVTVKQGWLDRVLAKAGYAKMEDVPEVVDMELSTADGDTLTIEREEGEPQVGDVASPDGEFVMPDGSTIVVADGAITEIRPAEDEETDDEKDARIAQLEQELEAARAQAKSANDLKILNAVKMAGGDKFLAQHCSSYKVEGRTQTRHHEEFENKGGESAIQKKLREEREKRRAKK